MPLPAFVPHPPDEAQRVEVRAWPAGSLVMHQQWCDLLFLHWEYPAAMLQATLPDGLFVDTFDGRAYLGVVPFFMRNIRPRFLPAVPGISDFMELNVRTYVHDRAGVPGVWFYSLDANQRLAVAIARRFFHLPYEHARMSATRAPGGVIRYESTRLHRGEMQRPCIFEYAAGAELPAAASGTLEFFLVERYRLYSRAPDGLRRGAVFHQPYPLCRAEVTACGDELLTLDGFPPAGRPPDHTILSRGVDVDIFSLERL
jgi:uncharacterized protein